MTNEWGYDECCLGHYETDQFFDYTAGDRTAFIGDTNIETLLSIVPTSSDYSVNYIYDDFSWDHCEDVGSDVMTVLEAYYNSYMSSH